MSSLARVTDKHITIASVDAANPVTVTRADVFDTAYDSARGTYNPALFEVTTNASTIPSDNASSLRLENIIIDDGFKQPDTTTVTNKQDAIVAAYGLAIDASSGRTVSAILGPGAILQNHGGNSALLATAYGKAVMESDSIIQDALAYPSSFTPTGTAALIQGGYLHMQDGSLIHSMARGAVNVESKGSALIDGEITDISGGIVVRGNAFGTVTFGPTGNVHDNTLNFWSYGLMYFQGGNVEIYGKINDNYSGGQGGGILFANNAPSTVNMYDGAQIMRNTAAGGPGGGVYLTHGTFTMHGGTISDNTSSGEGGGIWIRRGGRFIMNGGTIANNLAGNYGGGLAIETSSWGGAAYAQFNGGTVSQNLMGLASGTINLSNDLAITATPAGHIDNYLMLTDNATIGDSAVYMAHEQKTVTANLLTTKLANAQTSSINELSAAATAMQLDTVLATYWTYHDREIQQTVGNLSYDTTLPVYALVQQTDATGAPIASSAVKLYNTTVVGGNIDIDAPQESLNGSAIMLVQPATDYGTLVISTTKPVLYEDILATAYDIPYQLTYTISTALQTQIDMEGGFASAQLSLQDSLKAPLQVPLSTFDPDGLFNAIGATANALVYGLSDYDSTQGQMTTPLRATLQASDFAVGSSAYMSAVLAITTGNGKVFYIPSNVAKTDMLDALSKPASVVLTATKQLDGAPPAANAFSFQLKDAAQTVLQTKANDANGDVIFDALYFNVVGTHTYYITEQVGSDATIAYDTTVYKVLVTVTKPGDYAAEVVYEKNDAPYTGNLAFANTTKAPSSPEPPTNDEPLAPKAEGTSLMPKTGDMSLIGLWIALAVLSSAAIVLLFICRQKQRNKK